MVDFPSAPIDQELYSFGGTTWVYTAATGAWSVVNSPSFDAREFHDPTNACSWRIMNQTLEQWGQKNSVTSSGVTITFVKSFTGTYSITAAGIGSSGSALPVAFSSRNPADVVIASNNAAAVNFMWHAIGKWDGIS